MKRFTICGALETMCSYKALTRIPVYEFGRLLYDSTVKSFRERYGNPVSFSDAQRYAEEYNIEIGPECFYLPIGTRIYLTKYSTSNGYLLTIQAKYNPKIGSNYARISKYNVEPCEFELC